MTRKEILDELQLKKIEVQALQEMLQDIHREDGVYCVYNPNDFISVQVRDSTTKKRVQLDISCNDYIYLETPGVDKLISLLEKAKGELK